MPFALSSDGCTQRSISPPSPSQHWLPPSPVHPYSIPSHSPPLAVLLTTALVSVANGFSQEQPARALLDSGSSISFMTEACARGLRLATMSTYYRVSAIGNTPVSPIRKMARTTLIHKHDPPGVSVLFLVVPRIAQHIPSQDLPIKRWPHLQRLNLADPLFHISRDVDMLLGADVYPLCHQPRQLCSYNQSPFAIETTLGWVVCGPYQESPPPPPPPSTFPLWRNL